MFEKLIDWSTSEHKNLPWRENRNLYTTLVSEIMLQQTTVSTVLNHFPRFINKYPDIDSLAQISEEQMLIEWKGLGYYRRARNLLNAAKEIQQRFDSKIPIDVEVLKSIKGIGDYTANAIVGIGANERALAIDANLERVLSRIYGIMEEKGPRLQKAISLQFRQQKLCENIDIFGARNLNEALMDLGRVYCKARTVSCDLCPVSESCYAFKNKKQLELPFIKEKTTKKFYDLDLLRVIIRDKNAIYAYKKSSKEWLSGQYELPTLVLKSEDNKLKQYPELKDEELKLSFYELDSFKTSITSYKIKNYILECTIDEFKELKFNRQVEKISDFEKLSTASMKTLKTKNPRRK